MKISDLFEAEDQPKKPVKTKTKIDPRIAGLNEPKIDRPLAKSDKSASPAEKSAPKQKIASKSSTRRKTDGIALDGDAAQHLANLHANVPTNGVEDDTENLPTERLKPQDLPSVISRQMVAAGFIDPEWSLVADLPGNMSRSILQLGKQLFATFTKTPTAKITVLANVMNQGPNSPKEINAVAAYLKKDGRDLGPGEIDFDQIMPGYKADIHMFDAQGVRYMVVKDQFGQYIYSWPTEASLSHNNQQTLK